MSLENNNKYINENIFPLKGEKPEIILSLISDISKLDEKISEIKNSSNDNKIQEYKSEIESMKQSKNKLNKEIKSLSMNLLLNISNKDNIIKKKYYSIKELSNKIKNYKNLFSTYERMIFNSPLLKKYLISNNFNAFLSDEQIDDILSKTQGTVKSDNLKQKIEKDFLNNKEELKKVENDKKKILEKIGEIKENINMMKEEKIVTQNELINYISLKETLESVIKSNLSSLIKLYEDNNKDNKEELCLEKDVFGNNNEKYSRNRIKNSINNIPGDNDNNDNSYLNNSNNFELSNMNKNVWENILTIYKYELHNLDENKLAENICNDIFDLLNSKINQKDKYNMYSSICEGKDKNIKMIGKIKSSRINDRYSSFNHQNFFSDSPIVKRTKSNVIGFNKVNDLMTEYRNEMINKIKIEIKNLINNINDNIIFPTNFSEDLSNIIIKAINEKGYKLNKKNLIIYLSCLLKKAFYENQINSKIKFINKDYKIIKKNKKKLYDKLQEQLTKINSKLETIKNNIILQENKLNLLNNDSEKKKNKTEKNEINDDKEQINLSLEENNFIQLCRKANSLINEKNDIQKEIDMIENDKKLEKYQGEIKINNLKNELNELDNQILSKEKLILENKRQKDESISKLNRDLEDKYISIRENLISYKKDCSKNNNLSKFNDLIDNINNNIQNNYYKTLYKLEKFYIKEKNNNEINTNKENINDIFLRTNKSFNFKSYKKNYSNNNKKLFSSGKVYFSPVNRDKQKKDICQNKIKNNYINIFDSYNNLNNYFFQFQTSSTMISLDKQNKMETNNIITNVKNSTIDNNRYEINNLSNSSPFSSPSKVSNSSKKKIIYQNNNEIKPKNLIYNLRYLFNNKKNNINENIKNNLYELKLSQNNNINLNLFKNRENNPSSNDEHNKNKNNFILSGKSKEKEKIKNINNFINLDLFKVNADNKIFCYFKILSQGKSDKILNPLKLESNSNLSQHPFNYIKSTIYFDKSEKKIKIFPSNQLDSIDIHINEIENYGMNSSMKQIIEIYKDYKRFKENNNDKDDVDFFIKKIKKNNLYKNMNDEEIKKCCDNKKFTFEIIFKNKKGIELLFISYEEFKIWNDNFNTFIKNKKEMLFNVFNLQKFSYSN